MNGISPCPALMERIQQEHNHLNGMLREIQHRLAKLRACPERGPAFRDVVERVKKLRSRVAAHFDEEEREGCLDELALRCPSASSQVREIETAHRTLLPLVDEVVAYADAPVACGKGLAPRFEQFARKLREHEAAESRLFQYALGGEASEYDIEGNE